LLENYILAIHLDGEGGLVLLLLVLVGVLILGCFVPFGLVGFLALVRLVRRFRLAHHCVCNVVKRDFAFGRLALAVTYHAHIHFLVFSQAVMACVLSPLRANSCC
jgi:hypothetical protein